MEKAESFTLGIFQPKPEGSRCIKQFERADYVGLEKTPRSVNRAIHVRFGCEVDNRKRPRRFEQRFYNSLVPNITSHECVTRARCDVRKVEQISRIRELV